MTDYRELSDFEKAKVDERMLKEIEPKHHVNKRNGYEYDEPDYTIASVHNGNYCAECWMVYYNCLCSHSD